MSRRGRQGRRGHGHQPHGERSGTGSAGSPFSKYDYPGTYSGADLDTCRKKIVNYRDRWEAQNCEMGDLPDLDTGEEHVRKTIAGYLNDLLSLGIDGFRVDAAKHIPEADLVNIKSRLTDPGVYWKQETIGAPGEDVQPSEYYTTGDVQEFTYAYDLKRVFGSEKLAVLKNFGEGWNYLRSDKASVFVTNHDTERNGGSLSYKDGADYTLAHVFMLAWPYGSPDVHSGYEFTDHDAGGPNNGRAEACYKDGWKCQHAWREIASMVKFRNTSAGAPVTHWWDNGGNQIAFGRGDKAYVAINHEAPRSPAPSRPPCPPAAIATCRPERASPSTPPAGSPRPWAPTRPSPCTWGPGSATAPPRPTPRRPPELPSTSRPTPSGAEHLRRRRQRRPR